MTTTAIRLTLENLVRSSAPASWRGGILRHAAVLASGHALAMACGLVAYPLLCRIYTPEAFGWLAIFNLLTVLAIFIGTLRFENAIPLPRSDASAAALATVGLIVAVGLGSIMISIALACYVWRGDFAGQLTLGNSLALLAAAVLNVACYQVMSGWSVRHGHFGTLSQMRVAHVASALLVQFLFPFIFFTGGYGLVVGQVVGFGTAALWGAWHARLTLRVRTRFRFNTLARVALQYRKYPALDIPASLFSSLSTHGPPALTALLYGTTAAGCYALAYRLLAAPLAMLGHSVSRAYYNHAVGCTSDDGTKLKKLFRQTVVQMMCMTAVPVLAFAIVAPLTFGRIFGNEWHQSGIFVALLAPAVASMLLVSSISPTFDVLERLDIRLFREAGCAVLVLLGILLPRGFGWSVVWAVAVSSGLATAGQLASLWLAWRALQQSEPLHDVTSSESTVRAA